MSFLKLFNQAPYGCRLSETVTMEQLRTPPGYVWEDHGQTIWHWNKPSKELFKYGKGGDYWGRIVHDVA